MVDKMFLELLSASILGGKIINEKIEDRKPYKHVFNRPEDIQDRREAQELYDCTIVKRVDTFFKEKYLRTVA